MLIAIPSDAPGGLDATVSEHFGHCAAFTLIAIDDGKVGEVTVLDNVGHEQGGCMAPVQFLKGHDVEVLLAGGMGMRPLAGFRSVGIKVHSKGEAEKVGDAVQQFVDGKCPEFSQEQTCGGGSGGCGGHDHGHGHHHAPVKRDPIEGTADVQKDRVVSFEYELKDSEGNLLDASAGHGPMQYLHGHGNIVPGLEKALTGLEAGAHKVVEVAAADGYGARDEELMFQVERDQLPEDATVGAMLRAQMQNGRMAMLRIHELTDESATLDANHPLADKDLVFDVTIVSVEAATAEEIEHGHAH